MEIEARKEYLGLQFRIYNWELLSFILIALAVVFLANVTRQRWIYLSKMTKLPQLKWKFYHFLGDAYHVLRIRRMKTDLPHHVYDFLMFEAYSVVFQRESIFNIWAGHWPLIMIHKADAVEAVMNNSGSLKKSWMYRYFKSWLGDSLLLSDGEKWKQRRKFLTPAFHFNILKNFLPIINKQSRILVSILNKHTSDDFIDITPVISRCTLDIMCESILGKEIHTQKEPNNPYAKSVSILTSGICERTLNFLLWPNFIFKMSPTGRKFLEHLKIAHDFTNNVIRERKKQLLNAKSSTVNEEEENRGNRKSKTFLDLLLDEHLNNNSISEEEMRKEVDTFSFGGHDTSSTAISWSMYLIGLHPGIQEKIHEELDSIFGYEDRDAAMDDLRKMKYLECVLKECMRLYPPVAFIGRETNQDIVMKDYIIPAGSDVMLYIYGLHRDPDVFPNPENFDPDRFSYENNSTRHPFSYVPFSAGPRNCIGQRFGFMELKTVISSVLRRFKVRSLDPRDRIHMISEVVLRPVESLRLEIRLRNPNPEKSPYLFNP